MVGHFHMKVHNYGGQLVMAVCDEGLLGRKLVKGKLTVVVNPGFYGGELVTGDVVMDMLNKVTSANFMGNECVGLLESQGKVDEGGILMIEGIKHVQIYDVRDKD